MEIIVCALIFYFEETEFINIKIFCRLHITKSNKQKQGIRISRSLDFLNPRVYPGYI